MRQWWTSVTHRNSDEMAANLAELSKVCNESMDHNEATGKKWYTKGQAQAIASSSRKMSKLFFGEGLIAVPILDPAAIHAMETPLMDLIIEHHAMHTYNSSDRNSEPLPHCPISPHTHKRAEKNHTTRKQTTQANQHSIPKESKLCKRTGKKRPQESRPHKQTKNHIHKQYKTKGVNKGVRI